MLNLWKKLLSRFSGKKELPAWDVKTELKEILPRRERQAPEALVQNLRTEIPESKPPTPEPQSDADAAQSPSSGRRTPLEGERPSTGIGSKKRKPK